MSTSSILFQNTTLGPTELQSHIVMAPLTRSRAIGNTPNALMATYYGQRAGAGLIITEGTSPSPNGLGYARIPGLFHEDHVRGWRLTTEAVHAKGGKIFVQLMHTGRVTHAANLPQGAKVMAPSALAAPGQMWTDANGMESFPVPHEMTEAQIFEAIAEFASAARLARQAGFDGVELHGANGYLIDQFFNTATNQRKDKWGGSVENRIRFAVEIAKAAANEIGADRIGMRVSPYGVFNGTVADPAMDDLYSALAHELTNIGLVYMHVVDHSSMGAPMVSPTVKAQIRDIFKGKYILSGGYTLARAEADLAAHKGDLVAFGRQFISNPDLVQKLKDGTALKTPDDKTFYTPGEKGYTDY